MSTILDSCPSGIDNFVIPSRIVKITGQQQEINAFHQCSDTLESFQFDSNNPSLEVIEPYAFYECKLLEKIDLSMCSKLTYIGDYSFSACSSVSTLLLPESVKYIGTQCFYSNIKLTSVTIPSSVESIGQYLFTSCSSLKTFQFAPNSQLKNITRWMIAYTIVETLTLPMSISYIESTSFEAANQLHNIFVEAGNNHFIDDDGVLYSIDYGSLITFPALHSNTYTLKDECISIEKAAFSYSHIESLTLNQQLKTINDYGFQACKNMTSISIPQLTTHIGYYAFNQCEKLKSIELPTSITVLNSYLFAECGFTEFIVPPNITSILSFCFYKNAQLQHVILSVNLKALSGGVFSECHPNIVIEFPDESQFQLYDQNSFIVDTNIKYLFQYLGTNSTVTIPESISDIKSGAFQSNLDINKIIINTDLKHIENKAFSQCHNLQEIDLTGIESIGSYAFESCHMIQTVEFGINLRKIDSYAFQNCGKLSTVIFTTTQDSYYLEMYSFYSCPELANVTFSKSLQYIEDHSFANCISLKSLIFPSTLEYLGDYCFEFSGIEAISFEDEDEETSGENNSEFRLQSLGNSCFKDCKKLSSINLPETISTIGNLCFSNTNISSFTVPLNTSTIGAQAFNNCNSLVLFSIPNESSLIKFGEKPFSGCYSLRSIENNCSNFIISTGALYEKGQERLIAFPPASPIKYFTLSENVHYISAGAFSDCVNLQIITIPDNSVIDIGSSAFEGCINLHTINIPESVVSIGPNAFSNCNKLRCGLSIDEQNENTVAGWVYNSKLPQRCVLPCKERTCFSSRISSLRYCCMIFLYIHN